MTLFFTDFKVDWKIRITAPTDTRLCEILEASIIALKRPSLNQLVDFGHLNLFRNGVTYMFYIIMTELKLSISICPAQIFQFIFCFRLFLLLL